MGWLSGFAVTLRQIGRPKVTERFPMEKRPKGVRFHGRHVLNRYEDGMEKCIGCELCAGVCPGSRASPRHGCWRSPAPAGLCWRARLWLSGGSPPNSRQRRRK